MGLYRVYSTPPTVKGYPIYYYALIAEEVGNPVDNLPQSWDSLTDGGCRILESALAGLEGILYPEGPYTLLLWNSVPKTIKRVVFWGLIP